MTIEESEALRQEVLTGNILEIINNVDPQGLVRSGCPLDEHMMEAQMISRYVEKHPNVHRDVLAEQVKNIFDDVNGLEEKARQSTSLIRRIHRREYEQVAYRIHKMLDSFV
jgi:hypothetical protein